MEGFPSLFVLIMLFGLSKRNWDLAGQIWDVGVTTNHPCSSSTLCEMGRALGSVGWVSLTTTPIPCLKPATIFYKGRGKNPLHHFFSNNCDFLYSGQEIKELVAEE